MILKKTFMYVCLLPLVSFLLSTAPSTLATSLLQTTDSFNCSTLCSCNERVLKEVIYEYSEKHALLSGKNYKEDMSEDSLGDRYMFNFRMGPFDYSYIWNSIVEISCKVSDGKSHNTSEFLNMIHDYSYTALHIKCDSREDLFWDIGSWRTTVNIFVSDNCRLQSLTESKEAENDASQNKETNEKQTQQVNNPIQIPVNLWILEVYNGGENVIQNFDITYAMNMFAFIVTDSTNDTLPIERWNGKFLQSVDMLALINSRLDSFSCSFLQTNTHIHGVNLAGNELSSIPECLVDPRLTISYLSLAHNRISRLDVLEFCAADVSKCVAPNPKIEVLNLSYNEIVEVGVLTGMNDLHTLDLSHNFIQDIGQDTFTRLPKLRTLLLNNNHIHGLVDFVTTDSLAVIDFSNNYIERATLAKDWEDTKPVVLNFAGNKFRLPPFYACANTSLLASGVKIYAQGNKFSCGCQAMPFQKCKDWIEKQGSQVKDVFVDIQDMHCDYPSQHQGKPYPQTSLEDHCVPDADCPSGCTCRLEGHVNTINCSGSHLLEMPPSIPLFDIATSTRLYLDHNPIQTLGSRSYLPYVTELYLHDCYVSTVNPNAFDLMPNIEILQLHRNLIEKLPPDTKNITLPRARNITLYSNRWACTCDQLWLPEWMARHAPALHLPDRVVCRQQKTLVSSLSALETDCSGSLSISLSILDDFIVGLLFFVTFASSVSILLYYRWDINLIVYVKTGIRLWQPLSYGDAFSVYDAFLFYSQTNYKWVVDYLVQELESGPRPYRLCLHFRDFPKDEVAIKNIPLAIHLSRCTILVLCDDFLDNEWTVKELRSMFKRQLMTSHSIIVCVMDEAVLQRLPDALLTYMQTHEFILVNEPNFRKKLEYLLPPPRQPAQLGSKALPGKGQDLHQGRGDMEESTLREQGDIVSCCDGDITK